MEFDEQLRSDELREFRWSCWNIRWPDGCWKRPRNLPSWTSTRTLQIKQLNALTRISATSRSARDVQFRTYRSADIWPDQAQASDDWPVEKLILNRRWKCFSAIRKQMKFVLRAQRIWRISVGLWEFHLTANSKVSNILICFKATLNLRVSNDATRTATNSQVVRAIWPDRTRCFSC